MKYPDVRIGGGVCPRCGGCDFYCADCVFPRLAALEAVADAARAVRDDYQATYERQSPILRWWLLDALANALDALDKEE